MCAKLFRCITVMFLFVNIASAQNLTADISSTVQSDFLTDFSSIDEEIIESSEASTEVYYDIPEQVSHFNWRTKSFDIAEGTVKYTQAELLDEDSNETVKTVKLSKSKSKVDMSDVPSGSYYLILSNDAGEVHSEKIVIL